MTITWNNATTVDDFGSAGHRLPMLIYKIFRFHEWEQLKTTGQTSGAPIDLDDGYIHFSTSSQAQETADKHFAGAENLYVAAIDATKLGTGLKWEVSRGGAEFPHLYGKLNITDVEWCLPLPLVKGRHEFPEKFI